MAVALPSSKETDRAWTSSVLSTLLHSRWCSLTAGRGKEFIKDPGEVKGGKEAENCSREEMRIFCSKEKEIRCQTNHRWKNLKLQLKMPQPKMSSAIRQEKM